VAEAAKRSTVVRHWSGGVAVASKDGALVRRDLVLPPIPGGAAMKCAASVALQWMAVAILGVAEAGAQLEPTAASVYFWEQAPGPVAPSEERMSASLFDADHSRYIGFNLSLGYLPPGALVRYPVSCRVIKPNGKTMGLIETVFEVQPTWRRSNEAVARGWDEPGHWMPGKYRVECSSGDDLLIQRTFEMTANPPELSGIRFFEAGKPPLPPPEQRKFASRFEAARSRYVYVDVTLDLPAASPDTPRPIGERYAARCEYFLPDGRRLGAAQLEFLIQADSIPFRQVTGVGWDEPGHWVPGTYRVVCSGSGRSLGEATFEMTSTSPAARADN
jgi:hypothetical protein